jgi:hypothetical protein
MYRRSVKTGHCIAWSNGCHSEPALFWKDNFYQIDVCQQEQWGIVWNQSRRVITRPMLSDRHQRLHLTWCLARCGLNLRTWHRIHWSDERRFLLHVIDGRMRVWRQKNTVYAPGNTQPTVPYGGCSEIISGCISHDCKLDLGTIRGNLTGDQYIRDVLQPVVVLHFDNHPLAARPMFMDDNAMPHRTSALSA